MQSRHVSVVVRRGPGEVYAYARDPENLPRWAAGLTQGEVDTSADGVIVDSPMGRVEVRFAPTNDLGVLDHVVRLPSGERVLNPLRVLAHPDGSEVLFTVRQLAMSEAELDRDAASVAADLERLRRLLEADEVQQS
ncbi:polyketide cyclase [Marmoricola endophyticus]|uniref:Polyketide cyclase n=1 Tax=Marmoricola endophyticus TaxID=2040280 RepID=A0A917BLL7_9ACTN|nr:SRPBCC family protein [Marmoricola endophyticus]GGF50540.1 polyketide cyclase [Marmoricola endophyticus]